jgi:FMN phosphatase YigB (HAD superfamily)
VGDSLREDVEGARAAGIRAVLLARADGASLPSPPAGVPVLRSLAGLPALIARAAPYAVRR